MMRRTAFVDAWLALALCGCAAMQTDIPAGSAPGLAAGWQDHSRALSNYGAGPHPGTTVWYVPGNLPHGSYEVISRDGDNTPFLDCHKPFFCSSSRPSISSTLKPYNAATAWANDVPSPVL